MSTRKDVAIQSLRGLAVILMVAGHVIGSNGGRGLQVGDHSLWRLSYVALEDLRMPLFTAISGFVFALRPAGTYSGYPRLVRGKVRRLLVPMLTVGALLFVVKLYVPGVNYRPELGDVWRIYLYPFEHLWFLQAMFLIFLVAGLLDAAGRLARLGTWGMALAASGALYVLVLIPDQENLFSANKALRLLPFFLLGVGLHRFAATLDRRSWLALSLPVFTVVYGVRMASVLAHVQLGGAAGRALGLAVGLAGMVSVFLLRQAVKVRFLALIGGFSFGIYLLHVFAAAAARVGLQRAGVDSDPVLFLLCLCAGVALPIAFELTAGRVPIVSRLILGNSPVEAKAAGPAPTDEPPNTALLER